MKDTFIYIQIYVVVDKNDLQNANVDRKLQMETEVAQRTLS